MFPSIKEILEKEPGVYLGEYAVLPADNTQGMNP
jgi:hypothetical protein